MSEHMFLNPHRKSARATSFAWDPIRHVLSRTITKIETSGS